MSRIFFKTSCREWRICGTMNTEQRSFLYRNVERSNAHGNKSEYETQGQGACGSPQGRIPAQRWQVRFPLDFPGWQATFYLCRDLGGASGKGKRHSARFAGRHQGRSTVRHPERCVHPVGKGQARPEGQHFSELSVPLSAVRGAGFRQIEGVCAQKVGCEAVLQHAGRRARLADFYD